GGDSLPSLEHSSPSSSFSKASFAAAQMSAAAGAPQKRGAPKGVVAGIVARGMAAGLYFALRSEPETASQAATPPPGSARVEVGSTQAAAGASAAEPPAAPAVETVRIHIEVKPADAHVTLDGSQLPKVPFTAELRKDGTMHHIQASAPGYEPRKIM